MASCPTCGAATDEAAVRCPVCDAPIAAGPDDVFAPLPPLPDGGLAAALPDWLREPAVPEASEPVVDGRPGDAAEVAATHPPSGTAADVSEASRPDSEPIPPLLTDADMPAWLRAIGQRGRDGDRPPAANPIPKPAAAAEAAAAGEARPSTRFAVPTDDEAASVVAALAPARTPEPRLPIGSDQARSFSASLPTAAVPPVRTAPAPGPRVAGGAAASVPDAAAAWPPAERGTPPMPEPMTPAPRRPDGSRHVGAPRWVPFLLLALVVAAVLVIAWLAGARPGNLV